MEVIASRCLTLWMITVVLTISILMSSETDYKIGPNPEFIIFNIAIDTAGKYAFVVSYCFINSGFRSLCHSSLQSWVINQVQDTSVEKTDLVRAHAHEIVTVVTIYNWVDWYIYINILLSQMDMVLVEILTDVLIVNIITIFQVRKIETNTLVK